MKENNIWSKIKNGLKKAVTFVVDVLLFIPRFLINGIKGFFKNEAEAEEIIEEFDDDSDEAEKPVVEEATAEKEKSRSTEETVNSIAEDKSEAEKPVEATEEPKQEETIATSTGKKVEVKVTVAAAEEPQPATEETVKKTEEKSEVNKPEATEEPKEETKKDNSKSEKATQKVEKTVAAEVIDNQTGKVVKDNVKAVEEQPKQQPKDYPKFAKSDKNTANFEAGMVLHYNIAGEKYGKSMWADGAKELHRFASCFLHASAAKEGLDLNKPFADDDAACIYILDCLSSGNSKAVNITEDTKEFLKSCLGNHLYTLEFAVKPRMYAVGNLIDGYQKHFYREEYLDLRQKWMDEQARREAAAKQAAMHQQARSQNNSGMNPGVSFA